jgi:hypothetical protein
MDLSVQSSIQERAVVHTLMNIRFPLQAGISLFQIFKYIYGTQKMRITLYNGPNSVSNFLYFYLWTDINLVSETLWLPFLYFGKLDDGKV